MSPAPCPLDGILAVEESAEEETTFTTRCADHGGVSFGGETLGCAVHAAARRTPDRALHSLHAYFLRPVPPETSITLRVANLKEGRRLAHRRVSVWHDERLLCELTASFATPGSGPSFQDEAPVGELPAPESCLDEAAVVRREGWTEYQLGPLEWRWVGIPWQTESRNERSLHHTWVRVRDASDDPPALRAARLAYLSDYHSHWGVARKLGAPFDGVGFASLDTALWLHADRPWTDWRLLVTESDVGHAGRALTRRRLYEQSGELIASMAQEALIPGAKHGAAEPGDLSTQPGAAPEAKAR